MEIMWLLIPLSAGLVLVILAIFGWALHRGQFDDIEAEGERILTNDSPALDPDQVQREPVTEESARRSELPK
ncbi:MAG: cbb3-type cytochrome oxidase assembly protein CcoS [Rubrivivax sp.]|nr:cbb3-type cytochrome oxidase assembly protein CcoS [Rubrivivax sp.]